MRLQDKEMGGKGGQKIKREAKRGSRWRDGTPSPRKKTALQAWWPKSVRRDTVIFHTQSLVIVW